MTRPLIESPHLRTPRLGRREHQRTRTRLCVYCGHVSRGEGAYKAHLRTHPVEERVATCPTCGKTYYNQGWAYLAHVRVHEPCDQRFFSQVRMTSGCWLWIGAFDGKGYPKFLYEGKRWGAHRVSYENLVGPIPEGLELDHLCFTPACVRPEHLEPVTHAENTRRMHARPENWSTCPECGLTTNKGNIARHMKWKHREVAEPLSVGGLVTVGGRASSSEGDA